MPRNLTSFARIGESFFHFKFMVGWCGETKAIGGHYLIGGEERLAFICVGDFQMRELGNSFFGTIW